MLVQIKHVLGEHELKQAQDLLLNAKFRDGKLSAGIAAQLVKNNEELSNEKVIAELDQIIMDNLVRHPEYQQAALPHRIAAPFYVRYKKGMEYGDHIDDPIMGEGQRYRSDIAITIFLTSPNEYEGGELIIQSPYGEQKIKCPAGDAVLYPASTRHHITPITRGERLVAVTWVQSLIRNNEQRYLLYQLSHTREKMLRKDPNSEDTKRIDNVYVNLVRMWSEV